MRALSGFLALLLAGVPLLPMGGLVALRSDVTMVTVCTVDGVRQVALDGDGTSIPLDRAVAHHRGMCPLCVAPAGPGLAPPPVEPPAPPSALLGTDGFAPRAATLFVPEEFFLIGHPSRAPPAARA